MSPRPDLREVMELLARLRAGTVLSEEQELLAVAINALLFIGSTGQRQAFAEFLASLGSEAPPPVIAAFDTRAEADAWLDSAASAPDSALVLVGDQYHCVMSDREGARRRLIPLDVIEFHLGRLKRQGLPPLVATFPHHDEAEAWLARQDDPPPQALVTIAGQDYLAVHHRGVHRRALYPLSRALDETE